MGWRALLTPALILAFLSMTQMGSPRVMPRETEAVWSWLPWCYQATLRKWSSFVISWPPSTPLPACHSPALGWWVHGAPIRPPLWMSDAKMGKWLGFIHPSPPIASLFSSSPGTPFSEHWTWWFDLFFHIFPLFFLCSGRFPPFYLMILVLNIWFQLSCFKSNHFSDSFFSNQTLLVLKYLP